MDNNSARKFGCSNCSFPYEAFPPNDLFNIALPMQCEDGDCIEIKYECENCHTMIHIFWDKKHFSRVFVCTKGIRRNPILSGG